MSEHPGAPVVRDRVEIIDRFEAVRVGGIVESADDGRLVLRLEQSIDLPAEALLRWFDGSTAWQVTARLERTGASRVSCRIVPPRAWEPTRVRSSTRAPTSNAELLARIVSSIALPAGRRVHTECLDVSATGCRATWPGRTPRVGDTLELTWDVGDTRGAIELGWVAARVARIIPLASGESEICLTFEVTRAIQAARIRAWHRAWLDRTLPNEQPSDGQPANNPYGGNAAPLW